MSANNTVDVPADLLAKLRKFRLGKRSSGSSALVVKINKQKLVMEEEEEFDSVSLEDLVEELPENSPRYVVLSYALQHNDGRTSYPLCIVYWAPSTSSTELLTLYTSALSYFSVQTDIAKVIDIRDGELTKDLLDSRLGK